MRPLLGLIGLLLWRRGWDSNPRSACADACFQDKCTSPLCDLSKGGSLSIIPGYIEGSHGPEDRQEGA